MTNGEKIKAIFPNAQIDEGMLEMYVWLDHEPAQFTKDWWNAEYKEPTTKNVCDSCGNSTNCMMQSGIVRKECGLYKPTTKNDLGVNSTPNTISFKEMMDILKITAEDIENAEDLEYSIEPLNYPKNDLAVDAVSRKAVINQIFYSTDNNGDVVLGSALRERIARLPSVTPQEPKTGHWIKYCIPRAGEQHYQCTNCEEYFNFGLYSDYYKKAFKFCPNCGAKMFEPQESEEQTE